VPSATARRTPLTTAAAVAALLAVDLVGDPVHRHVPLCPFHAVTGFWCPLCGGLRAVYSLAHGRVTTALHDNVLVVAAMPLAALAWAWWWQRHRQGRPAPRVPRGAVVAVVVLAAAFTVARNLSVGAVLAPR
jgi:Protein of unknown function (DUF2752)